MDWVVWVVCKLPSIDKDKRRRRGNINCCLEYIYLDSPSNTNIWHWSICGNYWRTIIYDISKWIYLCLFFFSVLKSHGFLSLETISPLVPSRLVFDFHSIILYHCPRYIDWQEKFLQNCKEWVISVCPSLMYQSWSCLTKLWMLTIMMLATIANVLLELKFKIPFIKYQV